MHAFIWLSKWVVASHPIIALPQAYTLGLTGFPRCFIPVSAESKI
jgi:hypothetical protein